MIKITVEIIKRVENGMLFHEAVDYVVNNMKIEKVKDIVEEVEKSKNRSNKDIKGNPPRKAHKNKTEDILPSNEKAKSFTTTTHEIIMNPEHIKAITFYSNSDHT